MTTRANRRRWATFMMIDTVLLLGAGSAMAAPIAAPAAMSVHLPSVLLAGIGLIAVTLAHRRTD